jgi:uncharacterized membrane protein YhaH (DUF805 family)
MAAGSQRSEFSRTLALLAKPFRDIARYDGRSTRTETILFAGLTTALVTMGARQIWPMAYPATRDSLTGVLVSLMILLPPTLALLSRRMHDHDRPGWPAMLLFLALAACSLAQDAGLTDGLAFLVAAPLMVALLWTVLAAPTSGPNRYGPDPRLEA